MNKFNANLKKKDWDNFRHRKLTMNVGILKTAEDKKPKVVERSLYPKKFGLEFTHSLIFIC